MNKNVWRVLVCAAVMVVGSGIPAMAEAQSSPAQQQDVKAAEKKLEEVCKNMDELAAESKKAEGDTRAEINRLYEEFKKKQGEAGKDLETMRKSTNESWDKAKVDMDKALKDLNGLYERSKAKFHGKDKGAAK